MDDLHSDFCRGEAWRKEENRTWHFRLLQGHVPSLLIASKQSLEDGRSLEKILKHDSEAWHGEDSPSPDDFLREHLSKLLRECGLVREFCGLV